MPANSTPGTKERAKLAQQDWRESDHLVLSRPQGASNYGYAYHEMNDEGEPICGAGGPETEFKEITVIEAQNRGKCPCQMCERIIE